MKEIIKASLAGIGFVFDQDAFEIMESYISDLKEFYKNNPDGQEIINDIEARMVEIILSRQSCEQVVDSTTTREIIEQMGTPEDVVGQSAPESSDLQETVFPRRLYRNREGAKLGGICNGLASYFDIDPVLVRIGMVSPLILLIIFSSIGFHTFNSFLGSLIGSLCLLYLIMWFAVPAAKTPRQKLEMQGRRITASEIEREMSTSGSGKEPSEQPKGTFSKLFSILGSIVLFCIKLLILFIGFIVAISALGILAGIVCALLGVGGMTGFDFMSGTAGPIAAAMILCLIFIPLAMIAYQLIRVTLGYRNNSTLMWILGGIWIILAVFFTVKLISSDIHWEDLKGSRYVLLPADMPDRNEGWEIYEENVRRYRDSIERVENGTVPEMTGTPQIVPADPQNAFETEELLLTEPQVL